MINHLVEDCAPLVDMLDKPLKDDFFTLGMFEASARKLIDLSYIWQFPEGGWVSVVEGRSAAISSVNENNLQLSLASMSAVSSFSQLFISASDEDTATSFYGDKVKGTHKRKLMLRTKKATVELEARDDVHIRPAEAADLKRLVEWQIKMMEESGDKHAIPSYEIAIEQMKKQVAFGYVSVIENNVQPIGYVFAKEMGGGKLKRLHIQNIFIEPSYRRFGIASYVMEKMCQNYLSNGGKQVCLFAASGHDFTVEMYRKLGFCVKHEFSIVYLK